MTEPVETIAVNSDRQPVESQKRVPAKGGKNRKAGQINARPTTAQLTVNVPRDVVAAYDQFAADSGVLRAQLFREALELYAALLQSGRRTYQQPGLQRAG